MHMQKLIHTSLGKKNQSKKFSNSPALPKLNLHENFYYENFEHENFPNYGKWLTT